MASLQLSKTGDGSNAEEYKHVHSARYNSKLKGPHLLASVDEGEGKSLISFRRSFRASASSSPSTPLPHDPSAARAVRDRTVLDPRLRGRRRGNGAPPAAPKQPDGRRRSGFAIRRQHQRIRSVERRGAATRTFLEMVGRDVEPPRTSRATEVALRGFLIGYRRCMGFE